VSSVVESGLCSVRRACRYLSLSRSSWHYRERGGDGKKKLIERIIALSRKYPRYGYRRIRALLMREGWKVGRKLVQQVRRLEGLGVKGKKPRRRRGGTSTALPTKAGSVNEVWSWDFVHTRTENGVPLKLLTLIDEYTRQCLTIRAQRRLRSGDILDALSEVMSERGVPQCIRSDNGSEFIAKEVQSWFKDLGIRTLYIDPGSPWQNGHVESFHNRLRDECLNQEDFLSVLEAQIVIEEWRLLYNRVHPHSKLGFQSPDQFAMNYPRPEPNIQSGPEMVT
jgi:transposase InsO family protein